MKKNKKPSFLLWFILGGVGLYLWYDQSTSQPKQDVEEAFQLPDDNLTLQERVQKKNMDIRLLKRIQQEEIKAEKFQAPLGPIDPLETESADLDRGLNLPEDPSMRAVFEDLKKQPYKNDMYEDPEHIARRQMEHQKWLEEHLRNKNQREREEFIKKFVQIAKEQGYKVHFTEDMKVLLRPIEPKEKEEEKLEEIKVIYE